MIWRLKALKISADAEGKRTARLSVEFDANAEQVATLPRGEAAAALCDLQVARVARDEPTGSERLAYGEGGAFVVRFETIERDLPCDEVRMTYTIEDAVCRVAATVVLSNVEDAAWVLSHVGAELDAEWQSAQGVLL